MIKKDGLAFLEKVTGNSGEFIIKDNSGITLGRIFLVEISQENNSCTLRLKFYKRREESYDYLKETLRLLLDNLFKNMKLNKVNIITNEEINCAAFIDLGFFIEGIFTENIKLNGEYRAELLFGINHTASQAYNKERSFIINGENITLKLLTPANESELLDYFTRNKEFLREFEPSRDDKFYTLEVQRRTLIDTYRQFLIGGNYNMGIFKNNRLIGKIQLSGIIMGVFKNGFIGYSLDKEEQGKGYMKEALRLFSDYAFRELDIHRLEAATLINNERSQSVLMGCGFLEIGISKKYLFINGEWRDHKVFYKLSPNI